MKFLASILMATLLATVAQPSAAQKFDTPYQLTAILEIMDKVTKAMNTIEKHCDLLPAGNILDSKTPTLAQDPRVIKMVADCKRQLKQKDANTKSTEALWLIANKFLSLTREEWLLLKSFAPDDGLVKKLLKMKR